MADPSHIQGGDCRRILSSVNANQTKSSETRSRNPSQTPKQGQGCSVSILWAWLRFYWERGERKDLALQLKVESLTLQVPWEDFGGLLRETSYPMSVGLVVALSSPWPRSLGLLHVDVVLVSVLLRHPWRLLEGWPCCVVVLVVW